MKIKVIIEAKHFFEGHMEEDRNECEGELSYFEKGEVLEFIEKQKEMDLHFKLTVLPNKIISIREGQQMIFDTTQKDHMQYETPFGVLHMVMETQEIEVKREENKIQQIKLKYITTIEQTDSYENEVCFIIEEI